MPWLKYLIGKRHSYGYSNFLFPENFKILRSQWFFDQYICKYTIRWPQLLPYLNHKTDSANLKALNNSLGKKLYKTDRIPLSKVVWLHRQITLVFFGEKLNYLHQGILNGRSTQQSTTQYQSSVLFLMEGGRQTKAAKPNTAYGCQAARLAMGWGAGKHGILRK